MSRYNEVQQSIWHSRDFKELSRPEPNAQTLWLWLLTHRITPLPGIYNAGLGYVQDWLSWTREEIETCFAELIEKNMCRVDWEYNVIYLPNWYKFHKPHNVNAFKSWLKVLDTIPNCELKQLFINDLHDKAEILGETYQEILSDVHPLTVTTTTKAGNSQIKPKTPPRKRKGNTLLSLWGQHYKRLVGTEYHASFEKDGNLLKGLENHYGKDDVVFVMEYFFETYIHQKNRRFAKENLTVGIFHNEWNKVIAEGKGVTKTNTMALIKEIENTELD